MGWERGIPEQYKYAQGDATLPENTILTGAFFPVQSGCQSHKGETLSNEYQRDRNLHLNQKRMGGAAGERKRMSKEDNSTRRSRIVRVVAVAAALFVFAVLMRGAGSTAFAGLPTMSGGGDLDPSFGTGGKVTTNFGTAPREEYATAILRQADGKIVVGGAVLNNNLDYSYDFALFRFNVDGSLDTNFDGDGRVNTDFRGVSEGNEQLFALALQPDGKIVAVGDAGDGNEDDYYDFAVARYNTDGSLDTSFGFDGLVTTDLGSDDDEAQAVAIQPDGKIVVAGYNGLNGYDFALTRYNSDGSLDTSFDGDGKATTDFGTPAMTRSMRWSCKPTARS